MKPTKIQFYLHDLVILPMEILVLQKGFIINQLKLIFQTKKMVSIINNLKHLNTVLHSAMDI